MRFLVLPRTGLSSTERIPAERLAAGGGVLGAALVLLAAPARAALQVSMLIEPGEAWRPMLQSVLVTTTLGRALQLQAIWGAAAMMGFTVARAGRNRGWIAAGIAVGVLALTPGLAGHPAASETPVIALAVAALHVLAAGAWIGTLYHLWRASRVASSTTLRVMLRSFHPIALSATAVLVASGAYQAWTTLGAPADLLYSTWGRLLLAKLALVGATAVLGYRHWRTAEARAGGGERSALTASFARELGIALLVIAVTAVLATSAPPE